MRREGHIYLQGEGHKHHQGPFTEQDLRRYWAYGIIKDEDWVWQEGATDCVRVKDFFNITPQKIGEKVIHRTILHRSTNWEMAERYSSQNDVVPVFDKPWILQVFAWLVALAATVCFLSLPATIGLSIFLYTASLALLAWYIWIKKSTIAWVSLGINVLLAATVFFFQPAHDQSKQSVMDSVSVKISPQPTESMGR
jgi:hypothetical protein